MESVWVLSGDSSFLPQTGTDFMCEFTMDTCWSRDISLVVLVVGEGDRTAVLRSPRARCQTHQWGLGPICTHMQMGDVIDTSTSSRDKRVEERKTTNNNTCYFDGSSRAS